MRDLEVRFVPLDDSVIPGLTAAMAKAMKAVTTVVVYVNDMPLLWLVTLLHGVGYRTLDGTRWGAGSDVHAAVGGLMDYLHGEQQGN